MNNFNEKLAKLAVNKSLLREYSNSNNDRIVYMEDDTEFQIQIFNPYNYTIGVSFKFNNQNESNQLLVLKPGERVWLDRYLNNEYKLKFSTYEVSNSQAVREAIRDNGNLCIKFYKEREVNHFTYTYNDWNNTIKVDPSPYKPIDIYYSTCDIANDNYKIGSNINTSAATCANYCNSITSASTTSASVTDTVSASSASTATYYNSNIKAGTNSRVKSKIETGRIDKGGHSNQKFNNVYNDFETWPFRTEYIKIMPTSTKPISSGDLSKKYCHNCGRKIKSTFKFCPNCGAKQ